MLKELLKKFRSKWHSDIYKKIENAIQDVIPRTEEKIVYNTPPISEHPTITSTELAHLSSIVNELLNYHNSREMRQIGGRLDFYLMALAITNYYSDLEKYCSLDSSGKEIVDYLKSGEFYRNNLNYRVYTLDSHYNDFIRKKYPRSISHLGYPCVTHEQVSQVVFSQDEECYALLEGKKVYLMNNFETAYRYWKLIMEEQLPNHPHCYLVENSSFNIHQGDIVADIGGAEGFFCIKHLDKIKHAYIFETSESWLKLLEKTYAPYKDKVTLVNGFVGDGAGNISLDDYFKDKEKPTFFKMDVEGSEGSVLRSMNGLLRDPDLPMRLAICTYHRQEDAPYIEWLLNGEGGGGVNLKYIIPTLIFGLCRIQCRLFYGAAL
jgi:hypothetical protein